MALIGNKKCDLSISFMSSKYKNPSSTKYKNLSFTKYKNLSFTKYKNLSFTKYKTIKEPFWAEQLTKNLLQ
jgi:hypothetical protein